MKKAIFIIAKKEFRDEEYREPKEVLENAGIQTITASTEIGQAIGKLGMRTNVDITLEEVKPADYDAVIFIGGPGSYDYFDNSEAHRIAKETLENKKILASICASVGTLANAEVLKGKRVTSFSGVAELVKSKGAIHTGKGLEQDGNIITADGPAHAAAFGEAILKAISHML